MTQLRQRMIEDMTVRRYSERTIKRYTDCIAAFARHFGRCPSTLGPEEIRQYQVHLAVDLKRSFTTLNQTVCALRFLYRITSPRDFSIDLIPYARRSKKLPVVLSRAEVESLLVTPSSLKHTAIVATFYSTGVRLNELRCLATADVDASRGTIRVNGKGSRQREVPLSTRLLSLLRDYWRDAGVDSPWLFPGLDPVKPLCRETIQKIVAQAARAAGLSKRVSPHVLRHTFATHLLESGVDLLRIQRVLGHASLQSTTVYLHLATDYLESIRNPLDLLPESLAADADGCQGPAASDDDADRGGDA